MGGETRGRWGRRRGRRMAVNDPLIQQKKKVQSFSLGAQWEARWNYSPFMKAALTHWGAAVMEHRLETGKATRTQRGARKWEDRKKKKNRREAAKNGRKQREEDTQRYLHPSSGTVWRWLLNTQPANEAAAGLINSPLAAIFVQAAFEIHQRNVDLL